ASTERRADRESEDEGSPSHARTISQLSPASTPRRAVLRLACPTEARSKLQGPQSLGHQAGDQPVVGPARRRGGVGELGIARELRVGVRLEEPGPPGRVHTKIESGIAR